MGLFFTSWLLMEETREMPNLDRNDVNVIDRSLMFNYRPFDTDPLLFVLGVLPVIVPLSLAEWNIRNDFNIWLTYGIMYGQAVGFTYGTRRAISRVFVDRYRPRYYFNDNIGGEGIIGDSFPSGSTAMASMAATFLSVTFSAEFPDSPWRIPIIAGSYTLAASIGVIKIMIGYHFLTDVLAGAALGAFYGWLIPTLHRRPNSDENRLSFMFTGNGAIVSLRF
jgi:membrane-associated phospholipid phosphatase